MWTGRDKMHSEVWNLEQFNMLVCNPKGAKHPGAVGAALMGRDRFSDIWNHGRAVQMVTADGWDVWESRLSEVRGKGHGVVVVLLVTGVALLGVSALRYWVVWVEGWERPWELPLSLTLKERCRENINYFRNWKAQAKGILTYICTYCNNLNFFNWNRPVYQF